MFKVHDTDDRTIYVELFPGFSVDILVEDPSGEPLSETMSTVICTSVNGNYCPWPLMYHVYDPEGRYPRTDKHGHLIWKGFGCRLPPGDRYVIALRHPDYVEHLIQNKNEKITASRIQIDSGIGAAIFPSMPAWKIKAVKPHVYIRGPPPPHFKALRAAGSRRRIIGDGEPSIEKTRRTPDSRRRRQVTHR